MQLKKITVFVSVLLFVIFMQKYILESLLCVLIFRSNVFYTEKFHFTLSAFYGQQILRTKTLVIGTYVEDIAKNEIIT